MAGSAVAVLHESLRKINTGFNLCAATEDCKLDAKISAEAAGRMFAEIKKVTGKRVRRVVLLRKRTCRPAAAQRDGMPPSPQFP
jgi:hypothetical protein